MALPTPMPGESAESFAARCERDAGFCAQYRLPHERAAMAHGIYLRDGKPHRPGSPRFPVPYGKHSARSPNDPLGDD